MSDLISRQAAIEAIERNAYRHTYLDQIINIISNLPSAEVTLCHLGSPCEYQNADIAMPSAQPTAEPEKEKAKRVLWTGWKGYRDTRYKCPNCKKPVKNDDVYCHRCGQRLMFPKVSHTPYVEGQKQELIVRWDDE